MIFRNPGWLLENYPLPPPPSVIYTDPDSTISDFGDALHLEHQLSIMKCIIVHKFRGVIDRRTWYHTLMRRIMDKRIPNDETTTVQILSGCHGNTKGDNGLFNKNLGHKKFYEEDVRLIQVSV